MKLKTIFSLALFFIITTGLLAQYVPGAPKKAPGRKKHVIIGASLFSGQAGTYNANNSVTYSPSGTTESSSSKTNYTNFGASLNLNVGYFVADNLCIGLGFGSTDDLNKTLVIYAGPVYSFSYQYNVGALGSQLVPGSLFFRYYLNKGDSSVVDFFVEGNLGYSYNSTENEYYAGTNSATEITVKSNIFSFTGNVNLAASFNVSRHFAIQLKAGVSFSYIVYNSPSFIATYQYVNGTTEPAIKQVVYDIPFTGSLGLQYRF